MLRRVVAGGVARAGPRPAEAAAASARDSMREPLVVRPATMMVQARDA